MPTIYNIRGTSVLKGPLDETRQAKVGVFTDSIMIDLARPGGSVDDDNAPRLFVEWKPNDGWYVYLSNGSGDPEAIARFTDLGRLRSEFKGVPA